MGHTGSGKEVAKVSRDNREGHNLPVVVLGRVQQIQLVHGGKRRDKDRGQTTRGHGGRLANVVLTGSEASTKEGEGLWESLGYELDDGETGNGLAMNMSIPTWCDGSGSERQYLRRIGWQ